jgi:glycosyltransferase involved in cell wall biosynthesis
MSRSSPAVSVIVPAYKCTAYIAATLESAFAQTFRDFELIVVNDGCPDTENLERELEPYQSRIVYIKQPNGGPGAARNTGVRAASAPIVAMMDSDDFWEPDYLAFHLEMFEKDPSIDLIYPNAVFFGDTPVAGQTFMQFFPQKGEPGFDTILTGDCLVFAQVTARREILLKAGLYDTSLMSAEDMDLWLRVAKAGGRIARHERPLVRYRLRSGSLSYDSIRNLEYVLRVLDKLLNRDDLTEAERQAVLAEVEKRKATMRFEAGRRALYQGDTDKAIVELTEANRYFRRLKPWLMVQLMRITPGFAYWLTRFGYYPGVTYGAK